MNSLLLQLADSGFPAGAFAHSSGMESLHQLGLLQSETQVRTRLTELCWHTAFGALPFLHEAHGGAPVAADVQSQVFLSNHVAQRASKAQGQAFLLAAEALFESGEVAELRQALPHGHLAAAFGAVLSSQSSIALDDVRRTFLFCTLRGALSALVRLGVCGPLRAQGLLRQLHASIEEALVASQGWTGASAVSVSPWLETAQASHDRLYSRLFQS